MRRHEYFLYPDVFGTTLLCLCYDAFGSEFINSDLSPDGKWSAETIRMEIKDTFDVVIPDLNLDKLMAAITLATTDYFYKSLPNFISLCNAINGDGTQVSNFEPLEPEDVAWAVTEAQLLQPVDKKEEYLEDIKIYIRKILDLDGIMSPPLALQMGLKEGDYSNFPVEDEDAMQLQAEDTFMLDEAVQSKLIQLIEELATLPIRAASEAEFANNLKMSVEELFTELQPTL